MSAQLKQKVEARLTLVHDHPNYLYTDTDQHLIDLYYTEVMRKFFENNGYKSIKETINISKSRLHIAKVAVEWFARKGILANPLPDGRLQLGSVDV